MKYIYLVLLFLPCWPAQVRGQHAAPGIQYVVDTGIAGHSRALIYQIVVEGNNITRQSVILREIGIREGDLIAVDSMDLLKEQVKLRLFNLQLFNEVDQECTFMPDGHTVRWTIRVRERWAIIPSFIFQFADRNFNTWFVKEDHDLRRTSVGLTGTDKNFRGNLETLAVTVQDGYTRKLGISYMRPYANSGQTNGFGCAVSLSQSRQVYYATDSNKLVYAGSYSGPVLQRQLEAGISYSYRPAYADRHIFQLSYKDYQVSDTILRLNPDYFAGNSHHARFVELSYRYEYNGVDNWNYSLTGYKVVGNVVGRQGLEGLHSQAWAMIEAGMFRNPAPRWYCSFILRGRLMYPHDQPYYFLGGLGTQTDYVRGYEYYIIDGYNYGVLRVDLKREVFNKVKYFSIKYFTAAPIRIYPKLFADAGYISSPSPGNSFLSNRLLYSYGAGVDIVTLYDIKIRIEFAWNHLKQNGLYLHFNSE